MKIFLSLFGCLVGIASTSGQNFSVKSAVVGLGGGRSAGGNFSVTGTIGQYAPGALVGGGFTLSGGLEAPLVPILEEPKVSISIQGETIKLIWPLAQSGYRIESSSTLGAEAWPEYSGVPVVQGEFNVLEIPIAEGAQFYRLIR